MNEKYKITLTDESEDQYYEFFFTEPLEDLIEELQKTKKILRKMLFQNTKITIEMVD